MSQCGGPRSTDKVAGDLLDAASAAAQIVARGQESRDNDRLLRLAGEAVISRLGDATVKLPDDVRSAMPEVPWDEIRANRILAALMYHRIDPKILWATLNQDVPRLAAEVERWQSLHLRQMAKEAKGIERDTWFDIGF